MYKWHFLGSRALLCPTYYSYTKGNLFHPEDENFFISFLNKNFRNEKAYRNFKQTYAAVQFSFSFVTNKQKVFFTFPGGIKPFTCFINTKLLLLQHTLKIYSARFHPEMR